MESSGISVTHGRRPALAPRADWLELRIADEVSRPALTRRDGRLIAKMGGLSLEVTSADDPGTVASLVRITISATNQGTAPLPINLKWTLPLAQQDTAPRWLIPALLYKDNVQQYDGGLPSLAGEPDIHKSCSPWWTFRADLTAVPMVMAWTGEGSVALLMEERSGGHMSSIGLVNVPGERSLVGAWPYREEPRPRNTQSVDDDLTRPVITFATLQAGESVAVSFWIYCGDATPHAYAPLLRETFARWDDRHPLKPWFPTAEAADHAAYGLFTWHYDRDPGALWETCSYDRYYAKNGRHVDRFDMHTGFVSGIPYAHALRQYGLTHERPDMADAGRHTIDFCCDHLTPFGTFWSKFSKSEGWTTGWPSPQRAGRQAHMGSDSGELQARTLAEATLFAARAALVEKDGQCRERWTRAVRSNLDFVRSVQRPDGNVGESYCRDGNVLDWDGEGGLHWISAAVEGYRLTGDGKYLDLAIKAAQHFAPAVEDAYLTGAPEGMHLLPTSEDPQNAVIAYVLLWEATGERKWLELARQAADLLMTFRWQYNTVFPEMTVLGKYDYRTKGLDISSPNNVHLHPYGLIAVPELLRLWEATGDVYLLKQTRNNLLGCHQMLASADGVFDARRGMMSERWHQSPNGIAKGGTLQLAHSWATGLVLYADLWVQQYGQLLIDAHARELVALEAVSVSGSSCRWQVHNPWPRELNLIVVTRQATGTQRTPLTLAAGATADLAI